MHGDCNARLHRPTAWGFARGPPEATDASASPDLTPQSPNKGAKAAEQCQRSENPADERHHHAMSGMMMLSSV
jgi:hypothetical protein